MAIGFNEFITDNRVGRNSESNDRFGDALAVGDFNNDGRDDLAIGVPGEAFGGFFSDGFNKGVVQVLYGANGGFSEDVQELNQDNLSDGAEEDGDLFGSALAVGDIDGDGFDDLVVGIPGEDVGSIDDAGAIHVVFGSPNGLNRNDTQIVDQRTSGIASAARTDEFFGHSIVVADFNRDGFDDVAVGAPNNKEGNGPRAGGVNIIYGSFDGLTEAQRADQFFNRSTPGILGLDADGNRFGESLTAGDFDGDGHQDLAIGVPGVDGDSGRVQVLYGSINGLTTRDSNLSQGTATFPAPDVIESNDEFGAALAAADFNGDGVDDLAIGVPGEDGDRGAVQIHYGRRNAILPIGAQEGQVDLFKFDQFVGTPIAGDRFGQVLAAKDLNNDGFADLVVGAPNKDLGTGNDAGFVTVIFGSEDGLQASGRKNFFQSPVLGLADFAEAGDRFGSSLAIGNFDGIGRPEIAVGVFGEDIGSATNAGGVNIIPSSVL